MSSKMLVALGASGLFLWVFPVLAQTVVHTQPCESISPWTVYYPSSTTADWSVVSSGTNPTCSPHEAAKMAKFNSYDAASGDEARLSSPDLDLTGAEVAECRFWMYRDSGNSSSNDRVRFQVSTNSGSSYTALAEFKRYSAAAGWEEKVVPLGAYTAQPLVRLALLGISGYGNNIFIDDLRVIKDILPAGAEGKGCSTGAECNSGICGVDPAGNRRCRSATTVCIDSNRLPVAQGTVTCTGSAKATCAGTDSWSVQSCYNDCGPYLEVDGCEMGLCTACGQTCDPFFGIGCDANAYCEGFFPPRCYYKKADGEACGSNKQCLSNNCVSSPSGSKFCEPAGVPCASDSGNPVSAGTSTCSNNDRWVCQASGGWSTQDCYTNCGFYVDVDQCVTNACVPCATSCGGNQDCKPGILCVGNQCVGDLPNGSTCQVATQCASNFCVDSRCCVSDCTLPCYRCDVLGGEGSCTAIPAGQDPEDECPGEGVCNGSCNGLGACDYPGQATICTVCTRCDGMGRCRLYVQAQTDPADECLPCQVCNGSAPGCAPVGDGQDPLNDCVQQPPESCATEGQCNGAGACRYWPQATECAPGSCTNGKVTYSDTCDGSGQCLDRGSGTCGWYRCASTTACAGSCQSHAICLAEAYCSAGGTCEPDLGEGTGCQDIVYPGQIDDAACLGGYCFDDNFDGAGAFCTSNPAACVNDGVSFASGYALCSADNWYRICVGGAVGWGELISCLSGLCDAGGGDGSGYRSGGSCVSGPGGGCTAACHSCEPFLADSPSACRTDCILDTHCWPGYTCQGGACRVPEGLGNPCNSQVDCNVGICVENVCCSDSCVGKCRSCKLPGHEGFCTMADQGSDPDNECDAQPASSCSTSGACDGGGNCSLWPAGTVCAEAHCEGTVLAGSASCNGSGECVPGTQTDCRPGRCIGNTCASSCNSHADCDISGFCGADAGCHADLPDGAFCEGVVWAGQGDDAACAGGFCFSDSWNELGAYCAGAEDACVAGGSVYQPGFGLCKDDEWYRLCIGGEDGWTAEISCSPADICDSGGGPGSGVRPAEVCTSGFPGGCSADCLSCFPNRATQPGVCATSCGEDPDCWPGYTCAGGTCQPGAGLGDACVIDQECQGWSCSQGVCCNRPCDGVCKICNDPAYLGVCVHVRRGIDPTDACEQQLDACGRTGACDGLGKCAFKPAGTNCAPASCTGGEYTAASFCDGLGSCIAGRSHPCASGACEGNHCAPAAADGDDGDGGVSDGGDQDNRRPVAEAGSHQVVKPGTRVTLDGSQSHDPEGMDLNFWWEQSSGPMAVPLSGGTTSRPAFTPPERGVYVFRLVVSDGAYDSAPDFTEVQVVAEGEGCGCSLGESFSPLMLLWLAGMMLRWRRIR